ncbi:unnamed protein product [Dibothriocephalus latus]|uniref:Uncharacterized protein n=1 Tax=Dibothriocephalus latus TaxID=60516 RepID=A0A3P7L6Z2_DIBLA|nr:unnamed protein product [Dibothriocephalus latus]
MPTHEAADDKSFRDECSPMSSCKAANFPFGHSAVEASFPPSGLQFHPPPPPPPKPECGARIKKTGNTAVTVFKPTFKVPTSMLFTSFASLHPAAAASPMPKVADHQVPQYESPNLVSGGRDQWRRYC